jgi:hypothetical protein
MNRLVLGFVFAYVVFAQQAERSFQLTAPGNLRETVATLRTVASFWDVSSDEALATVTVKGSAQDLALAEWLIPRLDQHSGVQEYRVSENDLVVVYPLAHTASVMGLQEIITALRTVADIQKVYTISSAKVIPLRGTPNQIALAKFILSELDQEPATRQAATVHSMAVPGKPLTAMVYGLAHADTFLAIQEMITSIRTVLQLQKIYSCTAPKLLVFLDTPEMVRTAEWLLSELDRSAPNTGVTQMPMPGGKDDVVRVFFLAHMKDRKEMNEVVMTLRKSAQIMFAYTHGRPPAIIVRGTADQISLAGQLIAQKDVI